MTKIGVILSTYGEPTRNSFAEQWMYSYRILRRLTRKIAKIPSPLLPIIATARGIQRVKAWKAEDFVSQLEPLTLATVELVKRQLEARGLGAQQLVVREAWEFRRPNLTDVFTDLHKAGCSQFHVVPMYMGGGDFTKGMTAIAIEDAVNTLPWLSYNDIEYVELTSSPARLDRLADVFADFVREEANRRGVSLPAKDWAVCLAAHGSVQTPPEGVDNGVISFGELCWRIYKRLGNQFGIARNGWLNHTRGGRWTEPSVERLLPRLREAGYSKLMYVPWGFTTDNAESALEGKVFCREMENPFERVEHLPCMNTHPAFIEFLADLVYASVTGTTPAWESANITPAATPAAMNHETPAAHAAELEHAMVEAAR